MVARYLSEQPTTKYGARVQRWLWVTLPDVYAGRPFRVGEEFVWSCHPNSGPGDIALLYRADLLKDFSHVFRQESDPYDDPYIAAHYNGAPACDCTLVAALKEPVTLPQIRADRVLSTWPAAQVGFHGTAFPIEPPEWLAFVALTAPQDRPRLRAVGGR